MPVAWMRTSWEAQRVRNSLAAGGELADEVGQVAVVGVAAGFGAQDGDGVVGCLVPVAEELRGAGVEEGVPGAVGVLVAHGEERREQGLAERVAAQVVEAAVVDDGGRCR